MRALLRHAALAALSVTALAVPAFAQQATPSVYPQCALTSPPSKAESEGAHGAYMAGKASFDVNEYDRAIDLFKDAYRRDCTKYELLSIIARGYELKQDYAEAVIALQAYLDRAPPTDPGNEQIRQRMFKMKQQVSARPPASATVAPTTTSEPASSTRPVGSGSPPAASAREHTVAPWIVAGAGAAATITGVALLVVGLGKISDSKQRCPTGPLRDPGTNQLTGATGPVCASSADQTEAEKLQSDGNVLGAVGGVVGGIGALALVGGIIWHFAEPTGPETTTGQLRLTPDARPGFAGATVGGTF
jgi:tetratricopeptide (TPR) repeat protein